jgi:hypothetical protein
VLGNGRLEMMVDMDAGYGCWLSGLSGGAELGVALWSGVLVKRAL